MTSRSPGSVAVSTRLLPACPRTTWDLMGMSGGNPPNATISVPWSLRVAASTHRARNAGEGGLRSARSPPGGCQARTGTSVVSYADATSAAYRTAGRQPGDPLTPTMTLLIEVTAALLSGTEFCSIPVNNWPGADVPGAPGRRTNNAYVPGTEGLLLRLWASYRVLRPSSPAQPAGSARRLRVCSC